MFTDWTQVDPHYFYMRGFIAGIVFVLLVIMPMIKLFCRRKQATCSGENEVLKQQLKTLVNLLSVKLNCLQCPCNGHNGCGGLNYTNKCTDTIIDWSRRQAKIGKGNNDLDI